MAHVARQCYQGVHIPKADSDFKQLGLLYNYLNREEKKQNRGSMYIPEGLNDHLKCQKVKGAGLVEKSYSSSSLSLHLTLDASTLPVSKLSNAPPLVACPMWISKPGWSGKPA
jgi:hypothetical protein